MRLEGLGQLKNPVTSWGIEPVTFQLVAYRVPQKDVGSTVSVMSDMSNVLMLECDLL
jgi:hypothetical protein